MDKIKKLTNWITVVILLGLIGIFLYYQLHLGLVRFLDLDEVAHLHWSFNAFTGRIPYKDFLYSFTPFYLYIIAPILFFCGKTFAYVLWGRAFSFVVFCFALLSLYLIAKKTRNLLFALFTILIFAYLPLPADKWLEVRPDGLGAVFALLGIWFLIQIFSRRVQFSGYFLSGLFLSLGFVTNPKTVFYIISVFIVIIFKFIFFSKDEERKVKGVFKSGIGQFIFGLSIPIVILFLLFLFFGNFTRAFYLVFVLPKEAGEFMIRKFPMRADLFFYPNEVYYGWSGYQFNYFANLAIYLLASITAIIRLISFLGEESKEKALTQLLLALLFITNLVAYIKFFPLKHTQYLVGVSPFVAYFFADFVFAAGRRIKKRFRYGQIINSLFMVIFIISMVYYGAKMHQVKASRTFADSFSFWKSAKNTFLDDEYIWDLTGGSLFYKDPYYICCTPYGDYEKLIKFQLPSLRNALKTYEVKHIFIQSPDRLNYITHEHLELVNKYYVTLPDTPSILYAGAEVNFEKEKKEATFELITSGWYRIYIDGIIASEKQLAQNILLDRKIILSNPIYLDKGEYSLRCLGKVKTVKFVY